MQIIWQTLIHIPWWVYLVFAYIIIAGVQALNTRVVSLKMLFIAPIIFTIMSIHTLLTTVTGNYISAGVWGISIFTGIKIGQWLVSGLDIRVDKKCSLMQLPGTWSTLIIMSAIFITKFYFGYELAVNPRHFEQIEFLFSIVGVSGLLTGLLIGKLIGYRYYFKNSEGADLEGKMPTSKLRCS